MIQRRTNNALTWIALLFLGASLSAQQIPRQSSEFTVQSSSGRPLHFSQFRGKALLVQFLLTDCPHCQEAARVIERLQQEYRARGLQAVAVAFNQDARSKLPGFVKTLNLTFPVGSASQLSVFQYLQLSATRRYSVPFVAFIDGDGILRAQFTGDDSFFKSTEANMRSNIELLLRRSAAFKSESVSPTNPSGNRQ